MAKSTVTTVHYTEAPPARLPIIYLAGPTWHEPGQTPWQTEAVQYLQRRRARAAVCIPVPRDGKWRDEDNDAQILWQHIMMDRADVIAFWIPREAKVTTIEIGEHFRSRKMVLGLAPAVQLLPYLLDCIRLYQVPVVHQLAATLDLALGHIQSH